MVEPEQAGAENDPEARYRPTAVDVEAGVTARFVPGDAITPDLGRRILGLLLDAGNGVGWAGEPGALEALLWMTRDHPDGAEIAILEQGEEVVGTHIETREPFLLEGRRLVSRGGGNRALAPRLQGRGLSSRLKDHQEAYLHPETQFLLGAYTHPSMMRWIHGRRRALGNPVDEYLLPLDARRLAEGSPWAESSPEGASRTAAMLRRRGSRLPRPGWARRLVWTARIARARLRALRRPAVEAHWAVERLSQPDEAVDAFLREALRQFELVRERSAAYLSWRYLDSRAGNYTVLAAREGQAILGYVVVGLPPTGTAPIADLLVLPGRLDVARSLLDAAVQVARDGRAPGLMSWLTRGHPYRRVLEERGFQLRANQTVFAYETYRVSDADLQPLADPALRSHLMLGDTNHG